MIVEGIGFGAVVGLSLGLTGSGGLDSRRAASRLRDGNPGARGDLPVACHRRPDRLDRGRPPRHRPAGRLGRRGAVRRDRRRRVAPSCCISPPRWNQGVRLSLFAGVMVLAAIKMALSPDGRRAMGKRPRDGRASAHKALGGGVVAGALAGLFGIGGGFVIVPPSGLVAAHPLSSGGGDVAGGHLPDQRVEHRFSGLLSDAPVDWRVLGLFALGGFAGMVAGTALVRHLPDLIMRRAFAVIVLGMGGVDFVRIVFGCKAEGYDAETKRGRIFRHRHRDVELCRLGRRTRGPALRAVIDSVLDFDLNSGRTATHSADRVIAFVRERNLQVEWILETHIHADHLTAAPYIKQALGGRSAISRHILAVLGTWQPIFQKRDRHARSTADSSTICSRTTNPSPSVRCRPRSSTPRATPPADTSYIVGRRGVRGGRDVPARRRHTGAMRFPGRQCGRFLRFGARKLLALPEGDAHVRGPRLPDPGGREPRCMATPWPSRRAGTISGCGDGTSKEAYVAKRKRRRRRQRRVPTLLLPSIQVNVRNGSFGTATNGVRFVKIPIDTI